MNKYLLKKGDTVAEIKLSAKAINVFTTFGVTIPSVRSFPVSSEQLLIAMQCAQANLREEIRPRDKECSKLIAAFKQGFTLCKSM